MCHKVAKFETYEAQMKVCTCEGNKVAGMPVVELVLGQDRMLQFNSSEYFMYPTHKNTTSNTEAMYGLTVLQIVQDEQGTPVESVMPTQKFFFGLLFA